MSVYCLLCTVYVCICLILHATMYRFSINGAWCMMHESNVYVRCVFVCMQVCNTLLYYTESIAILCFIFLPFCALILHITEFKTHANVQPFKMIYRLINYSTAEKTKITTAKRKKEKMPWKYLVKFQVELFLSGRRNQIFYAHTKFMYGN